MVAGHKCSLFPFYHDHCALSRSCSSSERQWLDDVLIERLHHMPSLMHLHLDPHSSASMTDKALARPTLPKSIPLDEQAGYLAPKLEFIGLSLRHQFCGAAFADMIESRLSFRNAMQDSDIQPAHMSPLKTVHLNLDGYSVNCVCQLFHGSAIVREEGLTCAGWDDDDE